MASTTPFTRRVAAALAVALLAVGIAATTSTAPPVTAATSSSGGLTTSASTSPTQPTVGQAVTVTASVTASTTRQALVDIEVYDPAGRRVHQQFWDRQAFTGGAPRTFRSTWQTTGRAVGAYTVKIGIFANGWSRLLHWNDQAALTKLVSASTTSTTVVPATTLAPTTTSTTLAPTTTVAPTTTTLAPATATTTSTTTSTTLAPPTRFATLPPGSALPSGAVCATWVRPAAEIRPENSQENANRGGRQYANSRTDWAGFSRVDGEFSGTTDEIIQWAACKWGIDEDIVRAQIIKESYWYMSANGDNGESWGLGQVRVPYHGEAFQYAAVNARNSSAYNLDYTYATWRACYEGVYTWLNTVERNGTYAAGDAWGCLGVWFSGRWYVGTDAYLNTWGDSVRWHYDNKSWLSTTFING